MNTNKLVSLLFLLASLSTASQQLLRPPLAFADPGMDDYLQRKPPGIVTVTLLNPPHNISAKKLKCTFVRFGSEFQVAKFFSFDKDGKVQFALEDGFPYQQLWLDIDHYFYAGVYVNTELNITIDLRKIKSKDGLYMIGDGIEYTGTDGALNKVMNEHVLYRKPIKNKLENTLNELLRSKKKYSEPVFLSIFDSIYKIIEGIDKAFIKNHPAYEWAINCKRTADLYGSLCYAYWFDKMPDSLYAQLKNISVYFTSNETVLFYNYLFTYLIYKRDNPKIDLNETLYARYNNYSNEQRALLDSLRLYSSLPDELKKETINRLNTKRQEFFQPDIELLQTEHYIKLTDSFFASPVSDILKTFLLEKGKSFFAQTYPEIARTMKTNWCSKIVQKELDQMIVKQKRIDGIWALATNTTNSKLHIGTPIASLPFQAELFRQDTFSDPDAFILNLRSRFPGQTLLIDFWATWCIPCIKDLPASKRLHETNSDLPVAYIYICTNSGSSFSQWKNRIAEMQIPGTHIYADDQLVNALKNRFSAGGSGFPTYVVIDSSGKLRRGAITRMDVLTRAELKKAAGL